jgi:hypothetical protein
VLKAKVQQSDFPFFKPVTHPFKVHPFRLGYMALFSSVGTASSNFFVLLQLFFAFMWLSRHIASLIGESYD